MTRATIRSVALIACAALLAACATLPPPRAPEAAIVAVDSPFDIGGRLSARRGDNGVAGSFSWTHDPPHDAITLATPLGQTLARRRIGIRVHDLPSVLAQHADAARVVALEVVLHVWPRQRANPEGKPGDGNRDAECLLGEGAEIRRVLDSPVRQLDRHVAAVPFEARERLPERRRERDRVVRGIVRPRKAPRDAVVAAARRQSPAYVER